MKKRTSLLLATIAIMLTLVTLAASRRETEATIVLNPAIKIPLKDVRQVQIYHGPMLHAAFYSENGKKWRVSSQMVGMQEDAADRVALGDLMQMLHRLRTRPAENVTLKQAKLLDLNQAVQIVVQSGEDATDTVYLGAVSENGKDRYFVIGDDPDTVHQIDADLTRVVDRPVEHLRSWDLFDIGPEGPERIRLSHGTEQVLIERAVGGWAITEPIRWPAATEMVAQFLEACAALRATSFAPETLTQTDAGIDGKSPTLALTIQDQLQTVRFGKKTPGGAGRYALREGRSNIYIVSTDLVELASNPQEDVFRQRTLSLVGAGLASLSVEKQGETLRLQKKGTRWVASGARTFPVDMNTVTGIASLLQQIQVVGLPQGQELAEAQKILATPASRIQGADATGRRLFSIDVGPVSEDGRAYARIEGRDAIVRLDPFQALALQAPFVVFRDRTLTSLSWEKTDTLTIKRPGGTVVFKHSGGTRFRIIKPQLQRLTEENIFDLIFVLQKLCRLQAMEYVEENPVDLTEFGLDRPLAHVVLRMDSSQGSSPEVGVDLLIGNAKEVQMSSSERVRVYFARLAEGGPVFTLDSDLVKKILAPYP